jgi:mRNA-degrading endonuclease RelE of RelBE toxin-antitoxin system
MIELKINYSKSSQKFIAKNQHLITENKSDELVIKAVKKILYKHDENINLKKLKGTMNNQYRIRVGKIRIIFLLINGNVIVVDVQDIDFRGDVYKK